MQRLGLRRPSPGAVLGALALIVAMSGVAVAAIPGTDGAVTACLNKGGDLKVIDAEGGKACHGSQQVVKLAATDADGKVMSAGQADDADKLDGKDSTDFLGSGKLRSASVNADGTPARSSGFSSSTHGISDCHLLGGTDASCTGTYFLVLAGGVSSGSCTYSAMVGRTGVNPRGARAASTSGIATANGTQTLGSDSLVVVTTRNVNGVAQDLPFHLIAAC